MDIDLERDLTYKILVEILGFTFFVEVEYEKIHDYCNFCKFIGHSRESCKRRLAAEHIRDARKQNVDTGTSQTHLKDKHKQQPHGYQRSKPPGETKINKEVEQRQGHSLGEHILSDKNGGIPNPHGPITMVKPADNVSSPNTSPNNPSPLNILVGLETPINASGEPSPDESIFIDATQVNDPVDRAVLARNKDAKFVENVWGNLEDDESDNDDEEFDSELLKFQLVKSKSHKKKIRQKAKAKISYQTRSQYGTSKPSQ